jgi:AraC-like DNA-binding protein
MLPWPGKAPSLRLLGRCLPGEAVPQSRSEQREQVLVQELNSLSRCSGSEPGQSRSESDCGARDRSALTVSPSFGFSVVACGLFISSGRGTHPDRVLDNNELIVVRKGTLRLEEEQDHYEVPPKHSLLLQAGRRHRGATPFPPDLSFYWIHFKPETNPGNPHTEAHGASIEVPKFKRVERFDCIAEIFHRYLDDQEARRLTPLYSAALLLQILAEIARVPIHEPGAHGSALVGRAEAYITEHLADRLSTTRVARALRTNPDYLNRAFREVHGMTMTEFIHRRRLSDACLLLRETTDSVAEIAAACGYTTMAHFRRMFARYRGVSPSAYRQLMARAYVNAR